MKLVILAIALLALATPLASAQLERWCDEENNYCDWGPPPQLLIDNLRQNHNLDIAVIWPPPGVPPCWWPSRYLPEEELLQADLDCTAEEPETQTMGLSKDLLAEPY